MNVPGEPLRPEKVVGSIPTGTMQYSSDARRFFLFFGKGREMFR
jgi:hypothetical protein